ncbi:alpha-amylase family glycosyl hydrolase [Streptomyces mayteni]
MIYHIYPRSFQDSDGDGVGDLPGVIARLPYLAELGVDAVWLSPFFTSPQRDFGYDITDHTDVDPLFGTLADADALIAEAHRLGLRVLFDFVPNHTSVDHSWFRRSRGSRVDESRDWYLWRDPAPDGGPPNNWRAVTGGSAWTWEETTGQYYLHSFLPCQPDLNWRNPRVREAMHDVMRFWLDRGVDGFRVDMVDYLVKDRHFRDEPTDAEGGYRPATARYQLNQPEILPLLREFRQIVDAYPGRVLLGELEYGLSPEQLSGYYGDDDMLHLPFNFWLLFLPWEADELRRFVTAYDGTLPAHAWPNWVLGSHDVSRPASRLGPERTRAALLLLLTLRGTPVLYYGDELGMEDVPVPAERVQDPWEAVQPGQGRDPARTPMPWTTEPNGGFCPPRARPWLPLGDRYTEYSVERQDADPASMLAFVRELLALRRASAALSRGRWVPDGSPQEWVLAFTREFGDERVRVLINLGPRSATVPLDSAGYSVLLSSSPARDRRATVTDLVLGPHEGCVLGAAAR